jgi:hypothetical protein
VDVTDWNEGGAGGIGDKVTGLALSAPQVKYRPISWVDAQELALEVLYKAERERLMVADAEAEATTPQTSPLSAFNVFNELQDRGLAWYGFFKSSIRGAKGL